MGALTESATYEQEIYRLETTDLVLGGSNGISNLQAKQLANRTNWLKGKISTVEDNMQGGFDGVNTELTDIRTNSAFVPVGATLFIIGNTPPRGYVKTNGALLSRTTYAALWAFAQTALAPGNDTYNYPGLFGTGDGSTTFQLPDTRGWFPRFWTDGGGVDSDATRALGSRQNDGVAGHNHTVNATNVAYFNGSLSGTQGMEENSNGTPGWRPTSVSSSGYNANGTTENLVRNVALVGVIKY